MLPPASLPVIREVPSINIPTRIGAGVGNIRQAYSGSLGEKSTARAPQTRQTHQRLNTNMIHTTRAVSISYDQSESSSHANTMTRLQIKLGVPVRYEILVDWCLLIESRGWIDVDVSNTTMLILRQPGCARPSILAHLLWFASQSFPLPKPIRETPPVLDNG